MLQRAYSVLTVKSVDDDKRIIEGMASTPETDRQGDIVEPAGAEFSLPLPLLWQHNPGEPIGQVTWAQVTSKGIKIRAQIAKDLLPRIDEAWALIKSGLVRGLSIGFNPLESARIDGTFGYRFMKWEWLELSAVTIPANAGAGVLSVKDIRSFDAAHLAATGREASTHQPGATGQRSLTKRARIEIQTMKNTAEQISAYEATRQAKHARMTEIMTKAAAAGVTLDESEQEEYDTLTGEIEQIDGHLKRLTALKRTEQVAKAAAVEAANPTQASESRAGVIHVKGPDLPKGTAFTRYAMALAATKGDHTRAASIVERNKHWMSTTPQVAEMLKVGVAVGDSATTNWAEELVPFREMASEFVEFLRPQTLIGRIPGLRMVPFNIQMPVQTDGTVGSWVGEGLVKPVGKLAFDKINLRFTKVAKIIVITEELARHSSPSAEALVRQDLANGLVQAVDETFIDPDITAITDVRPGAITNGGVGGDTASGVTADHFRADLGLAFTAFAEANIPLNGLVMVTTPALAIQLALMRNPLGQSEFPGLTPEGGSLLGYPVLTSQSVPTGIVAIFKASEILIADDGGASIDVSREATVLMDDQASPVGTTTVNLWQQNMIGLRAERVINWVRRRDEAVYVIDTAAYTSEPQG